MIPNPTVLRHPTDFRSDDLLIQLARLSLILQTKAASPVWLRNRGCDSLEQQEKTVPPSQWLTKIRHEPFKLQLLDTIIVGNTASENDRIVTNHHKSSQTISKASLTRRFSLPVLLVSNGSDCLLACICILIVSRRAIGNFRQRGRGRFRRC